MKKTLMMCGAALLILTALTLSAAAQTSFAGTWVLDKAKSEIAGPMADRINGLTWTITQDAKELKVDPKMDMAGGGPGGPGGGGAPGGAPGGGGGRPGGGGGGGGRGGGMMGGGPRAYNLDGSETVAENPRGKTTSKAKVNGNVVEISSVMNMSTQNGDMTMNSSEKWELADGGKVLKVTQTRQTPNGEMVTKYHFNKQ